MSGWGGQTRPWGAPDRRPSTRCGPGFAVGVRRGHHGVGVVQLGGRRKPCVSRVDRRVVRCWRFLRLGFVQRLGSVNGVAVIVGRRVHSRVVSGVDWFGLRCRVGHGLAVSAHAFSTRSVSRDLVELRGSNVPDPRHAIAQE